MSKNLIPTVSQKSLLRRIRHQTQLVLLHIFTIQNKLVFFNGRFLRYTVDLSLLYASTYFPTKRLNYAQTTLNLKIILFFLFHCFANECKTSQCYDVFFSSLNPLPLQSTTSNGSRRLRHDRERRCAIMKEILIFYSDYPLFTFVRFMVMSFAILLI